MQSFSINGVDAINNFLNNVYNRSGKVFDPADEIKCLTDQKGKPVFSDQEATYLDNVMTECFVYCVLNDLDIYKLASQLKNKTKSC